VEHRSGTRDRFQFADDLRLIHNDDSSGRRFASLRSIAAATNRGNGIRHISSEGSSQ